MPSNETMVQMPVSEAQKISEAHAIRALAEAVSAQGRATSEANERIARHMDATNNIMEKFSDKLEGFGERVVRLEEQKHGRAIEEVKTLLKEAVAERKAETTSILQRISRLEEKDAQRSGVRQFVEFLPKLWPILLAFVTAIVTWKVRDTQ